MSEPKRTRLVFLGFARGDVARTVSRRDQGRRSRTKAITVEDWALVHKAPGGKLTIKNDKSKDPGGGPGRACSAAVPGGARGPVGPDRRRGRRGRARRSARSRQRSRTAGFKNDDIEECLEFMADGRTGIMLAMPLARPWTVGRVRRRERRVRGGGPPAPRGHRPGPRLRAGARGVPPQRGRRARLTLRAVTAQAAGERRAVR